MRYPEAGWQSVKEGLSDYHVLYLTLISTQMTYSYSLFAQSRMVLATAGYGQHRLEICMLLCSANQSE